MSKSQDASSRLVTDDFRNMSVINRHLAWIARPLGLRFWRPTLVALGVSLVLAACQAETAPAPKSERPVQVQRVTFETKGAVREFVGVVRARYETDLAFRVGGKIIARAVNVGDHVRAGKMIARLDPQDLRLQVESAEAELIAATSSLAQAAAELQRYTTLKSRGFAAIAEFDRKKAAYEEAKGRLARAQRALDLARNQLGYSELRANADGVITAALAEPGQVVAIGQPVARLAHSSEKEAAIAVPETWLNDVRKAKAKVHLWSERGRSFDARLRELAPQADPVTRTYAARFTIIDAGESVALGMTAKVTLTRVIKTPVAELPLSAVLSRGAGPSVYVVKSAGELTLRPVTIASFNEDVALITGGISAGDKVVTLGVQKLEPGLKVRTVEVK
jgi:RND family efflux transporter MFP subunit